MSLFMLVRRVEDLTRSCVELNTFLSFSRKHYPAKLSPLLGIWIDPHMVDQPPGRLASGQRLSQALSLYQTLEFQGVWTLCWLQRENRLQTPEITRGELFSALAEAASAAQWRKATGRFIPVFPSAVSDKETQNELQQLSRYHPQALLAPWFQHADSGLLMQPVES